MSKPRLLLVPFLTEVEWLIRPRLEEWAEVASFDAPGVGSEPKTGPLSREAIVDRGLQQVDRMGWDRYIVVSDGLSADTAVAIATARPEAVQGFALGHARVTNSTEGPRPALNKEVIEGFRALLQSDYEGFIRHGLTQVTHWSVGDELAERMIARIPMEVAHESWDMIRSEHVSIESALAQLGAPLLLAQHAGCIISTEEGYEDAVAAFPDAARVSVADALDVSDEFAVALREWVEGLAGEAGAAIGGPDPR